MPVPTSLPRVQVRALCLLGFGVALLTLTGCVSPKYKRVAENPVPPLTLNLETHTAALAVTLHTVIVYHGPGSWKQEAYWDEYILTLTNQTADVITLDSVELIDVLDHAQHSGTDPWALEKESRANLKKYERIGRKVAIGTGLTAAWLVSPPVMWAAAWAGSTTWAVVGAGTFVGIPVWAVTKLVRTSAARSSIAKEFHRRELVLPLSLPPHSGRSGSFFFPISPGPQRLVLQAAIAGRASTFTLGLTPLKRLHLDPVESARAAPTSAK